MAEGLSLAERVERDFVAGAMSKGLSREVVSKTSVYVSGNDRKECPVISFEIHDPRFPDHKTAVSIPAGLSTENELFAQFNGQKGHYTTFPSPFDVGVKAAEDFMHRYTVNVMGL